MSFALEHHGGGGGHSHKGGVPTPVLIGGGAVLLVLILLMMKRGDSGAGGGVTVIPGSEANPAIYQAQLGAYQSQVAAQAAERQDALRATLSLRQLNDTHALALGDQDIKRQATVRGLELQDKQITYAGENDRLDIQSRERVSLTDIAARERVGLRQIDKDQTVGLAQIDMQRQVGLASVAVSQSEVDHNYDLGKLRITTDDKFRNKALDKEYEFKFWDTGKSWDFQNRGLTEGAKLANKSLDNAYKLGDKQLDNDYKLGDKKLNNDFTLGTMDRENTRYQLGTERQGTWFNGIGGLLGPVGQFLKLFGL